MVDGGTVAPAVFRLDPAWSTHKHFCQPLNWARIHANRLVLWTAAAMPLMTSLPPPSNTVFAAVCCQRFSSFPLVSVSGTGMGPTSLFPAHPDGY